MMAEIKWTGVDELQAKLLQAHAKALMALGGAIQLEGETIMTRSKREFVPVDLGTLRGSGHVTQPEYSGHKAEVTLGYGGPAAAYALAVHEHPSVHSPPTWQGKDINWNVAGSGPKYLEKPMLESRKGQGQRIARRIKRRMDRLI